MKKSTQVLSLFCILFVSSWLWFTWTHSPQPTPQNNAVQSNPALIHPSGITQTISLTVSTLLPVSRESSPEKSLEAKQKVRELVEIIQSKNDNDPRLNKDFNHLTPETKLAMQKEYGNILPELKNERGTILFLLGKNLSSSEDLVFMQQVISEPRCLSLKSCTEMELTSEAQHHEDYSSEVTLAYTELVALKSLENFIHDNSDSTHLEETIKIVKEAAQSSKPLVKREASTFLQNLP